MHGVFRGRVGRSRGSIIPYHTAVVFALLVSYDLALVSLEGNFWTLTYGTSIFCVRYDDTIAVAARS